MSNSVRPKLRILLDISSLKSQESKRLMSYEDNDFFEFIAIGNSKEYVSLKLDFTENPYHSLITVDKSLSRINQYKETLVFGYNNEDIKSISKLYDIKYDDLLLVFILQAFQQVSKNWITILVTERKKILNVKNHTKETFKSLPSFSIFSPREASIYIDLYCKKQKEYFIAPHYTSKGFGLWYLLSMKTKVGNYQLPWSVVVALHSKDKSKIVEDYFYNMASLGDRLTEILIAIDEIGFPYYEGSNNDTMDKMIYHFNYWVSLYAGVIDSLAWITKYRYNIQTTDDKDIRLYSEHENKFIKDLSLKNKKLIDFIIKNMKVIQLVDGARDTILHRERLRGVRHIKRNLAESTNTIRISEAIYKHIQAFNKSGSNNLIKDFELFNNSLLIEPYFFVKNATPLLFQFVDQYLKLLDFEEYKKQKDIQDLIDKGLMDKNYQTMLKAFKDYSLGY